MAVNTPGSNPPGTRPPVLPVAVNPQDVQHVADHMDAQAAGVTLLLSAAHDATTDQLEAQKSGISKLARRANGQIAKEVKAQTQLVQEAMQPVVTQVAMEQEKQASLMAQLPQTPISSAPAIAKLPVKTTSTTSTVSQQQAPAPFLCMGADVPTPTLQAQMHVPIDTCPNDPVAAAWEGLAKIFNTFNWCCTGTNAFQCNWETHGQAGQNRCDAVLVFTHPANDFENGAYELTIELRVGNATSQVAFGVVPGKIGAVIDFAGVHPTVDFPPRTVNCVTVAVEIGGAKCCFPHWKCVNGICVSDPNGPYDSLEKCQLECARDFRYSCQNGECTPDPNGPFPDLASCQAACRPDGKRYSCINGACVVDPNGQYTSLAQCLAVCQPPPQRYRCDNGNCVPDPNGPYPDIASCLAVCGQPPPPCCQPCIQVTCPPAPPCPPIPPCPPCPPPVVNCGGTGGGPPPDVPPWTRARLRIHNTGAWHIDVDLLTDGAAWMPAAFDLMSAQGGAEDIEQEEEGGLQVDEEGIPDFMDEWSAV